jgi:hypothetical protein
MRDCQSAADEAEIAVVTAMANTVGIHARDCEVLEVSCTKLSLL